MRLQLSCYIEGDLDGIADYIAQDNPHRAVTFIQDIRTKFHDNQATALQRTPCRPPANRARRGEF